MDRGGRYFSSLLGPLLARDTVDIACDVSTAVLNQELERSSLGSALYGPEAFLRSFDSISHTNSPEKPLPGHDHQAMISGPQQSLANVR